MRKEEINALLSVIRAPNIRFMFMTAAILLFVTFGVIELLKFQWNEQNLWYIIRLLYRRRFDHQ
ncbi:unnamed protein product [Schistosoma turkestanicum]|nr:unnamed protein product [Schistosoma turkestanicum]